MTPLSALALALALPLFGLSVPLLQSDDPVLLGRQALAEGRLDEAQSQFERALAEGVPRVFEVYFALGRVHLQKRDFGEAKASFDECLARAPRFGPALVSRARAALFLGDVDGAAADLEASLALPDPPPEAQILERQLSFYRTREEPPASEAEIRRILARDLGNADAFVALGARHRSRKEVDEAVSALRIAQAIDDQNPVSFLLLKELNAAEPAPKLYPELAFDFRTAQEALSRGDETTASEVCRRILAKRPLFLPARLVLLHIAEARKDTLESLLLYDELFELVPDVPALAAEVSRLAERAGAYGLAECAARRVLAAGTEEPAVAYLLLANAQLAAEASDRAIATCERAIEAGFGTAAIYYTLGEARHQRMELGESIAAFEKAVELDPKAAESIASFALSSLTTEQYASLRGLLATWVLTHPDSLNTLYSLGVMYARDSEVEKAEEYFRRANALAPHQSQIQYNLALVYQKEGKESEAREAMERFRGLKEEEEKAFLEGRRLQDLRIQGRDALEGHELEKAIQIFGDLASSRTHEPSDLVGLGEGLLGVGGREEEARGAFERALAESPHLESALDGMARALEALGRKEEAEHYRRLSELLRSPCS